MARPTSLEKPAVKAKAISLIVEGLSDSEVAAALSDKRMTVSRQAITKFRHRHAAEIQPVVQEIEKQLTDYAIAHKVNRIAGLDALAQRVQTWIEERGLVELTETHHDNGSVTMRERFAREVSAELRALYKAAAEEMGDLPKPADQTINVNVGVAVALAWSDGSPA